MPDDSAALIIASKSDQASLNIANNLVEHHEFGRVSDQSGWEIYQKADYRLLIGRKECIYVEPDDVPLTAERIVFVSKHRSNQDQPALTVHATGNLGSEAKYGGSPSEISRVDANLVKEAVSALKRGVEQTGVQIEVTMEATHHGPTSFTVPVCFVEVGSTPKEWSDNVLGQIAADAVMTALSSNAHLKSTVGFGGTHYSARHTKVNTTLGGFAVGHIVPKHAFEARVADSVVRSTFERTSGDCRTALVDWKGLKGGHRQALLEQLSAWGIEVVKC